MFDNPESLARLLGVLYAAPSTPELWMPAFEQLAVAMDASVGALVSVNLSTGDTEFVVNWGDDRMKHGYTSFGRYNEWILRGIRWAPEGALCIGSDLWPENEMRQSIYYNEFLKFVDVGHLCGVMTLKTKTQIEAISFHRGIHGLEFEKSSAGLFELAIPHFQMALSIRRKLSELEAHISDLESALNQLRSALVLVDAKGKVVFVNQAARSILDKQESISLHNSRLTTRNSSDSIAMEALICRAILTAIGRDVGGGGAMRISRSEQGPLYLLISPFLSRSGSIPGRALVCIFFRDPEQDTAVPAEVWKVLFGFTPAETRLANALLQGKSLDEIAALYCLSRETVKSQIRSLFLKTGTKRQSELIRFLSRLSN